MNHVKSVRRLAALALVAATATAEARFCDPKIETRGPVQVKCAAVAGKADSLLPPGKKWKLVWNDEFDGKEIDRTKWMCRESFWGYDFPPFSHDFEGVEMTGETAKLNLVRKGDDFCSPHLQTGSLTFDVPRDTKAGFWPFGTKRKPLFMKRYGYFEIRCRQPKYPGWHSAFWFQAPGIGTHPDPAQGGIETDIMENYGQYTKGEIVGGNGWGGYGRDGYWYDHFGWKHEETADGWHDYGCEWTPEGYTFYCDGKKVGEQNFPVSHVEEFLLVSTEPAGYRMVGSDGGLTAGRDAKVWGKPDKRLFEAKLPDCFEVDFVRVYDEIPTADAVPARPDPAALCAKAVRTLDAVRGADDSALAGLALSGAVDMNAALGDAASAAAAKEIAQRLVAKGANLPDLAVYGLFRYRESPLADAAEKAAIDKLLPPLPTGDAKIDVLDEACNFAVAPAERIAAMSDLDFIAHNARLARMLPPETNEKFWCRIAGTMVTCARFARERDKAFLAQLMVPRKAFAWRDRQRALMENELMAASADGSAAALFAAYWYAAAAK